MIERMSLRKLELHQVEQADLSICVENPVTVIMSLSSKPPLLHENLLDFFELTLLVYIGILRSKKDLQKTWEGRRCVEDLHVVGINNGHLLFNTTDFAKLSDWVAPSLTVHQVWIILMRLQQA